MKGFTNLLSEINVSTGCFHTQCFVDVYKNGLYFRITQIIADKSGGFWSHAFAVG